MKLIQWSAQDVVDFDVTEAVYFWTTGTQLNPDPNQPPRQQQSYNQRRSRYRRRRQRRMQRRVRVNFGLEVTVDKYFIDRRGTELYNASDVFTEAECIHNFGN